MARVLTPIPNSSPIFLGFLTSKQHQDPFEASSFHVTHHIELVYIDLCRPMHASFLGHKYFQLFMDDFSQKTQVYFLKKKDEGFTQSQNFYKQVVKEFGLSLLFLQSDQWGEFTSRESMAYLKHQEARNYSLYKPRKWSYKTSQSDCHGDGLMHAFHDQVGRNIFGRISIDSCIPHQQGTNKDSATQGIGRGMAGQRPSIYHLRVFGSNIHA